MLEDLSKIKSIEIGKKNFKIEYFFAADEKMLALLLGVNAANSITPCISCKCKAKDFHDTSKFWSISEANHGARSFENACNSIGLDGQKHEPLVNFIPFSHFVFDLLHANLRISELLFVTVWNQLVILDKIKKSKQRQTDFEIFLKENVRILNPIYESNQKKNLKVLTEQKT